MMQDIARANLCRCIKRSGELKKTVQIVIFKFCCCLVVAELFFAISMFSSKSVAVGAESSVQAERILPPASLPKRGYLRTSVLRVVANPELFNQKRIMTFGYLTCNLENEYLWPTADFAKSGMCMTAVGIDFTGMDHTKALALTENKKIADVADKYVTIIGTFSAWPLSENGTGGSGSIGTIEHIYPLYDPR